MKIKIEKDFIIKDGIKYVPEIKEEKPKLPKDFTGWCKIDIVDNEKWLVYSEKGNLKYGIGSDGIWFESSEHLPILNHYREATESEVFEALKNEAVRRGFVEGSLTKGMDCDEVSEMTNGFEYNHHRKELRIRCCGVFFIQRLIFKEGQWAEICETITKQEAQKLIGKIIL